MKKISKLIRKTSKKSVIILALLVATILPLILPTSKVKAAPCSGSELTITRQSSAAFYVDTGYQYRYIAYSITTSATKSYSDLYVTWTNNGSSLSINGVGENFEDGSYHVGALGTSSTAYVYFYLKSSVVPPGNTPAGVQNYNLNLYNGTNIGNTADCTSAQSNTSIETLGFANSNKVTSVTYTAPYLGSSFTMTVTGDTGQIGAGRLFSYSPASLGTWNADCMELRSTRITLSGGNTGTYDNRLLLTIAQLPNAPDTRYTINYTFDAKCVTASSTAVAPLSYISSGSSLNHTNTAGFASLPPIAPATNSIVMTKAVSPASSTAGGTATYSVDITNNGPSSALIDSVVDVLPSSPANALYVSGSSYYDDDISGGDSAVSIANPTGVGQTKTWTRTFTIPSGKTGRVTYNVTIPSTAGSYLNSATGRSGTTVIDQTVDTTDNSPAVATYGVGSLSMAGSTKTGSDINGGSLQPGDIIEYTVVAEAAGNENAQDVLITDAIDTNTENLTNVVVGAEATNCGASYVNNSSSSQLNISGVNIAFGTSCIITFQVSVKASASSGTTILNTATIDPANAGGITGTPSSSPMVVRKDPILSVTNTENDADNVVIANQVITYTVTIRNTGQADANGVDLLATITGPVGSLSSRTLTNCGSAYVDTSSGTTIDIAALAITTSANCVITYSYTVNSGATSGTITNSVDITAAREGGNNPAPVSASNLLIGAAPTPPSLAVTMSDNDVDDFVTPGQSIRYTITITNSGQTDATTSLTSAIPTGMGTPSSITYSNCGSPSSSYSAPTLSISTISIPAANICTITYSVVVASPLDEGTLLIASVDVAAASQGGNNPAPIDAVTLTVDATPILGVTFTENDTDNIVTPGQYITYTATINNTGNGSATLVGAIDNLVGPAGSPQSFSFNGCGSVYSNNSVTSLDLIAVNIAVGTPCIVTYQNRVNTNASGGSTIDNSVDITAAAEGGGDPIPVPASTLTVSAFPELVVTSTENDADNIVIPGQNIIYTTVISNTGNGLATGVGLVDTFSGSISTIGNFSYNNCGNVKTNTSTGSVVRVNNLQITASEDCTITYVVTVSSNAPGDSTISNSADVSAAFEGGNNPNSVSATTQTVATVPNLAVTVSDNDADNIVTPGQVIGFTITISNNGNGTGITNALAIIPSQLSNPYSIGFSNCGSSTFEYSSPVLTLSSLSIEITSNCVITFNANVQIPAIEADTFMITANVSAASQGGNTPASVDTNIFTINTTPNLLTSNMIATDANGGTLKPGETINYTITIKNTGDGKANGVVLLSDLPSSLIIDLNSLQFSNCGSLSDNSTADELYITDLSIDVGIDCVISFSAILDEQINDGSSILVSATIGAANEGGDGLNINSNSFIVKASNIAPYTPYNVESTKFMDGNFVNPIDIVGATVYATIIDPNQDDLVRFRIQFARDCNFNVSQIEYVSILKDQGNFEYIYQENTGTYINGNNTYKLIDGNYCYRIRSEDEYGATSEWLQSDAQAFKIDHTPPSKPPAPFLIGEAGIGTADIGWDETDEPSPDPLLPYRLEYSLDPNFGTHQDIDTSELHKFLTGLTPGVYYYFRLYVKDSAGNISVPSDVLIVYIPAPEPDPDTDTVPDPVSDDSISNKQKNVNLLTPAKVYKKTTIEQQTITSPDLRGQPSAGSRLPSKPNKLRTRIEVTVEDTRGNKVKGAKVTIHSNPITRYTDKKGMAIFTNVPIGAHKIIVEYAGRISSSDLTITSGTSVLKIEVVMSNIKVKHCGWCCWLWLLLLIPLYYIIRHYYKKYKKIKSNNTIGSH